MAYEHGTTPATRRLPPWLRRPVAHPGRFADTDAVVAELGLHTVCAEARCPNRGECFSAGTATFLVLGDACTRGCPFCAVEARTPAAPDDGEPVRVAEAVARLGLRHAVVTMVTRDDLPDGGAAHVASTVRAIRGAAPDAAVEVLVSDFAGDEAALGTLVDSAPDVFNHNLETVRSQTARVRRGADYDRSLGVLARAAGRRPGMPVKSGLMLGLGETEGEVVDAIADLRAAGCTMLTLGQYLRPSAAHLPVERFAEPDEFARLARAAYAAGFEAVASAPFVRSSYHAGERARG
ncbi:MAG: lipoyl synthase [Actinobacteria bacterium]|nr:MAG: lipoyl synthase [Actinomycetota bacterium]